MKIACLIHSLDGGGAERVMAGLSGRLALRGHQVTLVTLDDGQKNRHELEPTVRRLALHAMSEPIGWLNRLHGLRHRVGKVREAIQALNPDVLLSFCDRNNILSLLATRNLKVPVVACERSDPRMQTLGTLGELARRVSYPRAARLVALTHPVAEYLQRFSKHQVEVIPSAVAIPPQTSEREWASQNRLILGIGRLEKEKGFDTLIRAFANFQRASEGRSWSLKILGEGSQRAMLASLIAELDASSVTMPGWIQPVSVELACATLFVLPSRYEGFPSALLEAMAMGVPCVAADCPSGPRVIIQHMRNGLLVAPTVDGILEGIRQMATDSDARERMGISAKEVCQRFSWDSMVDHYEAVLVNVVREQSTQPR